MRTLRTFGCALLGLVLLAAGCAGGGDRSGSVVVTTNILGDITREIVGDLAEVTVLMPPGADPHSFAVSAREAATLEHADLVVANGLGLEEGVARHVAAAAETGVATVSVAEHVDPLDYSGGDSRGRPDPHFWTDPTRVRAAVDVIAEQVVDHVGGIDAEAVGANARRYGRQLADLDSWMSERFAEIPAERRTLVTNHHVFGLARS